MTTIHAVVWIDHQNAQILQFDAEHVEASRVKAHSHHTHQHHSAVRTQHEFYGEVCDAMAGVPEILLTGSRQNLADFDHYVRKHRPQLVKSVVGSEVVDHPSTPQLVAMARKWFLKYDRMAGTPTPS